MSASYAFILVDLLPIDPPDMRLNRSRLYLVTRCQSPVLLQWVSESDWALAVFARVMKRQKVGANLPGMCIQNDEILDI